MSGGIDSTAAAVLLHRAGHEVIGVTLKTWDYATSGGSRKETGCCNLDTINDARQVAVQEGFPHYIFDIREEFSHWVVEDFVSEYLAGRTPNPCVLCNTYIKWEALIQKAQQLQCSFLATGHYARVRQEKGRLVVSKGVDPEKDQSYVLWGISQRNLAMTQFPLGSYTKADIRAMCRSWGYDFLARKEESYEICFVPDNDYRGFLRRRRPDLDAQVRGGYFVNRHGDILGRHEGYPFYTVGQRRGLQIAVGSPMYVNHIDAATNTVVLGGEDELFSEGLVAHRVNLQKYAAIRPGMSAVAKIRYRDRGTACRLYPLEDGAMRVVFTKPVKAVAPGQSVVWYEGDDVIGGGIILRSEPVAQG